MSKNLVGVIILVAMLIVGYTVMPIYRIAQIEMAKDQEVIINEMNLFLDKVADTKKITEEDLKDFTLGISATSIPIKFEVFREVHQVNPDPASTTTPKSTYSSWVPTENIYEYNSGDIIILEVDQIGHSLNQSFTMKALRQFTPEVDLRLARMVR